MADKLTDEGFANLPADIAADTYREVLALGDKDHASVLHQIYYEKHRVRLSKPSDVHEAIFAKSTDSATPGSTVAVPVAASVASESRVLGWVLFVAGMALVVMSFIYDPSVATGGESIGSFSIPSRVVNNGMLNIQLMMCIFGSSLVISGSVFLSRARP